MAIQVLNFFKAHGAGNDFVVLDEATSSVPSNLSLLAVALCCRRTGVGADGILVIRRDTGSIAMECWNSDGSRAEACGNGLRVITRVLHRRETVSTIQTDAGPVPVKTLKDSAGNFLAKTTLGPVIHSAPIFLKISETEVQGIPANVGNPHLVFNLDDFPGDDAVRQFGPGLEVSMPGRVNVGFYRIESRKYLKLRVWERGCGETLACGTGAAAAVRVLQARGLLDDKVEVEMPGGILQVRSLEEFPDLVEICGPARINFSGTLFIDETGTTLIDFKEEIQETT